MAFDFRLFSLNIRGLADTFKRRSVFHWIRKFHRGICFLQETHSTTEVEQVWRNEWGSNIYFSHGTNDSRIVSILMPGNIDYKVKKEISDPDGRYLILDIVIDDAKFILVNVYAPTKNKEKEQIAFLEKIYELSSDYDGLKNACKILCRMKHYFNPFSDNKDAASNVCNTKQETTDII